MLGIFRVHGLALTGRLEAIGLVDVPRPTREALRSASAEQSSRNLTADGMARIPAPLSLPRTGTPWPQSLVSSRGASHVPSRVASAAAARPC